MYVEGTGFYPNTLMSYIAKQVAIDFLFYFVLHKLQRFARILYLVSSGGSLKIRQRAAGWTALAWNLRH